MRLALFSVLAAMLFAFPSVAASEQTATYTAKNLTAEPDCVAKLLNTASVGLGGACFDPIPSTNHFRATIQDDILGPGYGYVSFCYPTGPQEGACVAYEICNGVGEADVAPGFDSVYVTVGSAADGVGYWRAVCGDSVLMWEPTHGTITLSLSVH